MGTHSLISPFSNAPFSAASNFSCFNVNIFDMLAVNRVLCLERFIFVTAFTGQFLILHLHYLCEPDYHEVTFYEYLSRWSTPISSPYMFTLVS